MAYLNILKGVIDPNLVLQAINASKAKGYQLIGSFGSKLQEGIIAPATIVSYDCGELDTHKLVSARYNVQINLNGIPVADWVQCNSETLLPVGTTVNIECFKHKNGNLYNRIVKS